MIRWNSGAVDGDAVTDSQQHPEEQVKEFFHEETLVECLSGNSGKRGRSLVMQESRLRMAVNNIQAEYHVILEKCISIFVRELEEQHRGGRSWHCG